MSTSVNDIREWLKGTKPKHTHMLIVCDTFDYEDYPVFTKNIQKAMKKYHHKDMQKVMEVYNLSIDLEKQLSEGISWHIEGMKNGN